MNLQKLLLLSKPYCHRGMPNYEQMEVSQARLQE